MTPERTHITTQETIDLSKLRFIVRSKWIWIVLLLLFSNGAAIIYTRYTKELFESESEIKLDIKQDATELGIRDMLPERQQVNIISAEIETIKSKLFLSRVIDSLKLAVTYLSIGKILNTDLHKATPFTVSYTIRNPAILNSLILIESKENNQYTLTIPGYNKPVTGKFNEALNTADFSFVIRPTDLKFEAQTKYAFVINSHEAMLDYITSNLTVEPLNVNANTIRVAFKDSNPFKAQDIVNGIDSIYLQYSNSQKNLANQQKIAWLNNELKRLEDQMEEYESYLENFTLRNRTYSLTDELKKTIAQINRLDSQRYELSRRIAEINRLGNALQGENFFISISQRALLPENVLRNLEKLQELQLETSRLMLSYQPGTLAYRQKEQEIETLRTKIANQIGDLKSDLLMRLADLTRAQTKLEQEFSALPDKNTQFNKQSRYYKLYEELYLALMQKKSEFEITMAGSTPDFKILSTATLPKKPISPNKLLVYAAGFVVGIFFSIVFVGVVYLFDDKITSIAEVEKFSGVPLLGTIPAFRRPNGNGLFVQRYPRSMVSEALRSLRTNLDFIRPDGNNRIIAISSTISGEGKSFIASNLGGMLAMSGKKVILLDVDMRKPPSLKEEGMINDKGISTILIRKHSWAECLRHTSVENFHYIPPGPQPPNPAELLLHGEFRSLLDDLKRTYDFILMDTPPIGLVTDGIMPIRQSDVAIYVFRANYSRKEFFNTLKRIIRIHKFPHLTAVLNALPASSHSGYGYYEDQQPKAFKKLFRKSD